MSGQISKSNENPTLQEVGDFQPFRMIIVNDFPAPVRGRPKQYDPCERYGYHRFNKNARCPCGLKKGTPPTFPSPCKSSAIAASPPMLPPFTSPVLVGNES